jgi:flagellar hook-associated protein 2
MLNIEGLASGLDTTSIIEGLQSIQQLQIDRYTVRKQEIIDQQTAFQGIEARLLALQSTLSELTRPGTNAFLRKSVTSSDDTAIEATVSNDAAVGVYTVRVNRLAQNHQIASQLYATQDAPIAKGTISLGTVGGATTGIVIDDTNDTLEGLALAINSALKDVKASLIKQGTGYRLLLTSNQTGLSGAITVSETAADPGEASLLPQFDLQNPVQDAQDAEIQLGSGPGAIVVTSGTNLVDDLFTGITLNLLRASSTDDLTLTVTSDSQAAHDAVMKFIDAYNDVVDYTAEQNRFDAETGEASILFGNRALLSVRDRLARTVTQPVLLPDGKQLNRLSALGVRLDDPTQNQNRLTVQSNRLDDALNGRLKDVTLDDVQSLFGFAGESDSQFVQFLSASIKTKPSNFVINNGVRTAEPYKVEVLQAARQATALATNALAGSIVIDATNNKLDIAVDGRQATGITLAAGTYTPDELAGEIEQQINDSDQLPGRQARVSVVNQHLQVTSLSYGKSSAIGQLGGTALATLGFDGSEAATGLDVVGNFQVLVDGNYVTEKATGSGRVLVGAKDNVYTAELRVRVTLASEQIGTGYQSLMTVTRGVAETLRETIDSLVIDEGENKRQGQLATMNAEFGRRIESIDQTIARLQARFDAQQQTLVKQFTALESQISQLQAIGNTLSLQLASLSQIRGRQ